MAKRLEIKYNRNLLIQGCVLILLGIMLPAVVTEPRIGIYETLSQGMLTDSAGTIMIAAVKLVMMNVIRAVPHYLGVFLINESVQVYILGQRRFTFNAIFTFSLILLVYEIIDVTYGIRYDFGIPALMIVAFVLLLSYMYLFSVSMIDKALIVGTLLMSVQWLDIIPYLSENGFGRGEISMDVKIAAQVIEEEQLLTVFAFCMFAAFFYASLIQVQLLCKEHKLKISNEKTMKVEKELYKTQIEALKLRNHSEVQSLVHDLKTPLTTVQGLISLAEMMERDSLLQEYFKKISVSLTSMSMMISEILYESSRSILSTGELMKMVLAQVSILVSRDMLHYENECPTAKIRGNRIRLSRALINLISNAKCAIDPDTGEIHLKIFKRENDIYFVVQDNGSGIAPDQIEHIWELGYSGRQSTGLGLAFARQVVENHHGVIKIESEKGSCTKAIICLKEES